MTWSDVLATASYGVRTFDHSHTDTAPSYESPSVTGRSTKKN